MTSDPLVGLQIGGYRVVSMIGRGGMGMVYRAEDDTGNVVAVKFMAPELVQSGEFRERFAREAEAGLDHPNVVPVYGAGEQNGLLYLTMYLVEGYDLKRLIAEGGKVLPARAVPIFDQAATALDEAHAVGIVHRDVKPQNILIEPRDDGVEHVYLTDFGLVKRVAAESSFTGSAHLIGSAQYMSPEQIQGRPIDGRSDVYSLGCVVFEALTGSLPFPQEEEVAVLWAHINEPRPKVTSKVPVLPEAVDEVVAKAMAVAPDDRYLTAGDLVSALAFELGISGKKMKSPWAAGGISSSAKRRRDARLRAAASRFSTADVVSARTLASSKGFLVGVAATLAVLLGWFALSNESRRETLGSFIGAVTGATPFAEPEGTVPEDREVASSDKTRNDPERGKTDDTGIGSGPTQPQSDEPPASERTPDRPSDTEESDASGDDSIGPGQIVFQSLRTSDGIIEPNDGALFVMSSDGSDEELFYNVATQSDEYDPAWSPDGQRVALASRNFLVTVDEDGDNPVQLTNYEGRDRHPTWSPNGKRLIFQRNPYRYPDTDPVLWELYSIRLADGRISRLTNNSIGDEFPDWSPDGKWIVFSRDLGGASGQDLFLMNGEGKQVHRIFTSPGDDIYPDWSTDGKRIAFIRGDPSGSGSDIWVLTVATGTLRRVTQMGNLSWPAWSPNGRWIAFGGAGDVWKIRASGEGNPVRLTDDPSSDGTPEWRPRS